MATTFFSDAFFSDGTPKVHKYVETGVYSITASYEIAAALVVDDLIKMVPVPAGARVKDVIVSCDELDTGADAIVLDVGDTDGVDDPDRYIDGATIGQAGGLARMAKHEGHNYQFAEDGTIDVLVETAPGTGATSGSIVLTALLENDGAP